MDIEPIETHYRGYRFRSRLEARWAVFFDALGIEWEYEPEGYQLYNGDWYLPDFYLPRFDRWKDEHHEFEGTYAEIKPSIYSDFSKPIRFIKKFNESMWLCIGVPDFREYTTICNDFPSFLDEDTHRDISVCELDEKKIKRFPWGRSSVFDYLKEDCNFIYAKGLPMRDERNNEYSMFGWGGHKEQDGRIWAGDICDLDDTYINAIRKVRQCRFDSDSLF